MYKKIPYTNHEYYSSPSERKPAILEVRRDLIKFKFVIRSQIRTYCYRVLIQYITIGYLIIGMPQWGHKI